jgi:hypothetical protein
MKFLLSFFLAALLGTAGVYYGAQPLWLAIGLPLPGPASETRTAVAPAAPADPYLRPATPAERIHPSQPSSTAAASTRPRLTRVLDSAEPAASVPAATSSGKPEAPPAAPSATTAPASSTPDEPAPAVPANPPAVATGKPLPPPAQGSKSWGMTITRAAYYALSGENRGKLPGGTVMDIEDSRSTEGGMAMSMGRLEREGTMIGPYLVANADLVRFNMSRSEVPADTIATLKQYYDLKGKLQVRLAELKQLAISSSPNPHTAAYAEAVQKYNDFGRREKQLVARRDAATGSDRMRYMDTLREMIPEGKRLERAVDEAKTRYNKWKAANPGVVAPDTTASDEQVRELRRQLAALEPQVKEMVQ